MRNGPAKPQKGSMLLEALIALLVFALGVLGLVGAQVAAQRMTADAKYRAEASMHADRLIAQMWSGDRSTPSLTAQYATGGPLYEAWKTQVQAAGTGLPGSTLSGNAPTVTIDAICPSATCYSNVVIEVFWQGPQEEAKHKHKTTATIK